MDYIELAETGRLPDWLIRAGVTAAQFRAYLDRMRVPLDELDAEQRALRARLRKSPIAILTDAPNRQHYDVPAAFFRRVLGRRMKYSCCYWPEDVRTIHEAEEAMLRLTCERARIQDGQDILDLGCGWGSFALYVAERFPRAHVWALSNSRGQKAYIDAQCRRLWITNVHTVTADVTKLEAPRTFDRIVSIEMFEHMRNYQELLSRISGWLSPAGLLFVHVFSHVAMAREFDARDPDDWMAQTFFTGGTLPSDDLLVHFQDDLRLVDHWRLDGTHYALTLRSWLERLDGSTDELQEILGRVRGPLAPEQWLARWRLFFLICEGTWGFRKGREHIVSHYLFAKR